MRKALRFPALRAIVDDTDGKFGTDTICFKHRILKSKGVCPNFPSPQFPFS